MINNTLKHLLHLAKNTKNDAQVVKHNLQNLVQGIIDELEAIENNEHHQFSKSLMHSIIDSLPWELELFKALNSYVDERNKKFRSKTTK